ncbi:NAD-dependent protein deacylase [Cytobacillus sp. Sa5YUA1]|uniref:NAD-dependent protein deacetylase n=1 Tax=Cytobacillus stercorigallinarum TaxID=2762240 RepID=A0ABR8QQS9_9BACI|nr:NAD-dependent protein deacylase [Cytobacillus stercorigallinarum]MBD7937853.1 NAD-dependent protein deacylase [Cytobacillus stercorigallinarum]
MLANWLKNAHSTVIFTGAGMSTESGLPDFRSSTGLWKQFNPTQLASIDALNNQLNDFMHFYQERVQSVQLVKPHKGHSILAKWEEQGLIKGIITQNVDGLHQEAGSTHVAELHGTLRRFHCQSCGKSKNREDFIKQLTQCHCGGKIRPSIVLFGEQLPKDAFEVALHLSEFSDLFIVLGSSLSVAPANQFPLIAKEAGARLVIINEEPTDLDYYADLVINERKIGEALSAVDQQL